MSWSQRIFLPIGTNSAQSRLDLIQANRAAASAAIASEARLHLTQIPMEYVGVNGEYDPQGLAKRVAIAFDQHPELHHLNTLCILQQGSRICLLGKVATASLLQKVVACARQIEGVQAVDVGQVSVEQASSSATPLAKAS
jgi:hypothetical protein